MKKSSAVLLGFILLGLGGVGCHPSFPKEPPSTLIANRFKADALILWDLKSGATIKRWSRPNGAAYEYARLSPDGTLAISSHCNGKPAILWEAETGSPRFQFKDDCAAVGFAANGLQVLTGTDGALSWWNVKTGHLEKHVPIPDQIINFFHSPDGQFTLVQTRGTAFQVEHATGKVVRKIPIPGGPDPVMLDYFKYRLPAFDEPTKIIDLWTGDLVCTLPDAEIGYKYMEMAASPDGTLAVTSPNRPTAQTRLFLWDLKTGNRVREFIGFEGWRVPVLEFSPDGTKLAAGGYGVTVWDVRTGLLLNQLKWEEQFEATSLSFSATGERLLIGRDDWR